MKTPRLLTVHALGDGRDLQSHPDERHHEMAVELAGGDHAITIAAIPLGITSSVDDGPETDLSAADTLAIADEIARRCNLHEQLVAEIKGQAEFLASLQQEFSGYNYAGFRDLLAGFEHNARATLAKAG